MIDPIPSPPGRKFGVLFFQHARFLTLSTIVAASAIAQVASPPSPANSAQQPPSPSIDGETIQLSPFEVATERDEGFVASSSLAGGRLALDLKDTPAAYSVVTRDFIDALNLTNLTEAAQWTTNTLQFADGQGGGDFFNITVPISVRGGGTSALRQRNFFLYFAPMDSYNLERYDFGRGPNSVLFGNGGTLGGVQTAMTKRARVDRPIRTIEQTVGSWDSYRTVLDVNQPVNDRLAFRAAAVYADRNGWRDYEMERTKAAFLTGTFKISKDTELRVEGEVGRQWRNTPRAFMRDFFSGWDGATVFNGPLATGTLPPALAQQGVDRRGSNYFVYDPANGVDAIVNFQNEPFIRGSGATSTTPIGGYTQVGTQGLGSSAANLLYSFNVPSNRFDTAIANSNFYLPGEEFTMSPDTWVIKQEFSDLQATLSHQFGQSLFVEIAAAQTRSKNTIQQESGRGLSDIYIDINQRLPNGAANPNFLEPYAMGNYARSTPENNVDAVRAALAYVKDLDKWGSYSASLMGA